ncbi:MAG: hypothetical protein GY707_00150 [Desulfobacteraceae bacterium]|nr:hypothetical protein [Desulfobacteraceae bacterium]
MMKTIFFPFAHLQVTDIKVISALFKSIFYFSASMPEEFEESNSHKKKKDVLLPIYPDNKDFELALIKVNEYRHWGELNKENKGNLKAFLQTKPYLTDNTAVSHIRAGIENTNKEDHDLPSKNDLLLKNLMFLRLAKIHDMEKESIGNQFNSIEKNEQKLFSDIQGHDTKFDGKRVEDFGAYMTPERLSAWFNFFNTKMPFNSFDSPLLFVTTSAAVMEYLLSVSENKIKLLDIDNLKVHENICENKHQWVEVFNKYVENLVISGQQSLNTPAERDDNCTLEVKIKLYLLQGDVISSFFQGVGQGVPVCLVSV